MRYRIGLISLALAVFLLRPAWPAAQSDQATRGMAHDIFKELIEINTTDSAEAPRWRPRPG